MLNIPLLTLIGCSAMALVMLMFSGNIVETGIFTSLALPMPSTFSPSTSTGRPSQPRCVLPRYDSWNSEIMAYVNLRNGEPKTCTTDFEIITELKNGKINVLSKNHNCEGRCIYRDKDWKNTQGKWQPTNTTFDCDIVESRCAPTKNATDFSYEMIHTQIIPVKTNETKPAKKQYNVFVFLIDSMATSQADRNIPKTMRYLEKSMGAVTFPYINKVGRNSRPNGLALWFGKQIEPIERTAFGLPTIPVDLGWKQSCDIYMDNFTSIFQEYREKGYRTFLADDWAKGMLNWPNCYGFEHQPVDHIMQPFQIEVETKSSVLYNTYTEKNCIYMHRDVLKYQQQFIDAYKGQPMFSWIWTSLLSHDYESSSMRLDTDVLETLVNNREVFDNSFVILMGDHGLRFGGVTNTKVGALDVNNPLLTISVPKDLRNSSIIHTLMDNAQQLQTHYDTRATLQDIVNFQPETNFTDREFKKFEDNRGQSFFRKQIGERSCRTLYIPFSYCICEMQQEELNVNSTEVVEVATAVINSINQQLKRENVTHLCNTWTVTRPSAISAYLPRSEFSAYSITAGVSAPYDEAQFRAVVHKSENGNFTVGTIDRVDTYGKRGHCVRGDLEQICDCKEQKKDSS